MLSARSLIPTVSRATTPSFRATPDLGCSLLRAEDSQVAGSVDCGFSSRRVEFHQNRGYVIFDSAVGNEQFICNLSIAEVEGEEVEYLSLSSGQSGSMIPGRL